MSEFTREEHPSYGMISFSRTTGGNPNMFGSDIEHSNKITVRIAHGIRDRGYSRDWYHSKGGIVEVDMTYHQYAEAISSMNMGDGVPCTIRRIQGKGVIEECPPQVIETEKVNAELEKAIQAATSALDASLAMSKAQLESSKPPTKKERQELFDALEKARRELNSNIPFIQDSFKENMDGVVLDAKMNVEAFVANKIHSLGLKGLEAEMLKLNEGK